MLDVPAGGEHTVQLRLTPRRRRPPQPFEDFAQVFAERKAEADAFYAAQIPQDLTAEEKAVSRQAYAGLLWSEQFYHYVVPDWINGDANLPLPPEVRERRINRDWPHLFSRDVLSVPDKWEYPAFFAWDLAFHMIPHGPHRPGLRQEAAAPAAARVVPASQRPVAGLRVRPLERQPAGPRLGLLAGLQDGPAAPITPSWSAPSTSC